MTTKTLTLTDFLLARIAEDEDAANGVNRGLFNSRVARFPGDLYPLVIRQHPARVLADCEAKRRIVEDFEVLNEDYRVTRDPSTEARRLQARIAMTRVAEVYANHPDYREEWRP